MPMCTQSGSVVLREYIPYGREARVGEQPFANGSEYHRRRRP